MMLQTPHTNNNSLKTSNISDKYKKDFYKTSESEADNLLSLLDNLKGTLPRVNEAPTLAMSNPTSFQIKRGIGAVLL